MSTDQLTGLQMAIALLAQIGDDDSDRAIAAVHDLANERDEWRRIASAYSTQKELSTALEQAKASGRQARKERDELRAKYDELLVALHGIGKALGIPEGDQVWRIADLEAEVAAVRAHVIAEEGDLPRVDTAQSVAAIVEQRDWLIESVRRTELERDELRARLAEIEAQEPVAISKAGNLFWAGNPQDWRGVDCSLFASPVPAQAVPDADGARFRWLCEDHSDRETRERCRSLIDRLSVMSYSDAVMSIDAAMAAAPEHKA